jgi:thiamine-monophosphate kinase
MDTQKRTEINQLGEFGLIDHLTKSFENQNKSTIKGIGDDAAVIDRGDYFELISTDVLIEGIHFDLSYTPLKHLGYKAVAVNVSDIAAMNGLPEQITVSIAISNRISVEALEELYEGIKFACADYKVDLVGGDTTSSLSGLMISVTAIGTVKKEEVVYRNGAQVGDVVCVTGELGGAYMGLQILEREKQVFLDAPGAQPKLEEFNYIVQRLLKPKARLDVIHDFKELGAVPNAMIDISDGLASELHHIAKQSDVGFKIIDENLPVNNETYETALSLNIGPVTCAMNGGEDYELLFTISRKGYEKLKTHFDIVGIGEVVPKEEGLNIVTKSGRAHPITAQGWNHFEEEEEE